MKPENKAFLEANRTHWITLRDAQYLRHLDGRTRSEMQRVMGEEFQTGYTADLWCPTCVADMVSMLYHRFEAWEKANPPAPEVLTEPELPIDPVIPELPAAPVGPSVQTKANFPSHKTKKR